MFARPVPEPSRIERGAGRARLATEGGGRPSHPSASIPTRVTFASEAGAEADRLHLC